MDLGGIETFLMTLYRKIDRSKIQFDFLVHRRELGFFDEEIQIMGGRLLYIRPLDPKFYFQYKEEFKAIIKQNNYSIVHAHLNANSTIVLNLAKKMGIRTRIAHSHIDKTTGGIKGVLKNVNKLFINTVATHKFACSIQAGRWLYGKAGEFHVFNNAIDSAKFVFDSKKRIDIRDELRVGTDDVVVGNIARFNVQKNHEFLLKVFRAFHKKNKHSKLLLLGEGELKKGIEVMVDQFGLRDAVIFTGAVGNANDYLNAMDVFVFPSLFEGLGIVAVEAQTNGLPVVLNEELPDELDITNLTYRLSLHDPVDQWVIALGEVLAKDIKRTSRQTEIQEKGYDVSANAQFLEGFYIEQSGK